MKGYRRVYASDKLVKGQTYWIVYRSDTQRVNREAVMKFLGTTDHGNVLQWDMRPVAGTQTMPRHWLIRAKHVEPTDKPYLDRKVTANP